MDNKDKAYFAFLELLSDRYKGERYLSDDDIKCTALTAIKARSIFNEAWEKHEGIKPNRETEDLPIDREYDYGLGFLASPEEDLMTDEEFEDLPY